MKGMTYLSLNNLEILLILLLFIVEFQFFTVGQYDSNIAYYSNVKNNSKIIGAFDTFSLFILKDRITNQTNLKIACQNSQPCSQIWKEISTPFEMTLLQIDYFYSDCFIGHLFDIHDGILAPSSVFTFTVRRNRYVEPKKSILKEGYEISDFLVIPLFPSQLILGIGKEDGMVSDLKSEMETRMNLISYSNDCKMANLHDMIVLDKERSFLNFSSEDISVIQRIRSIQLEPDWSIVNQVLFETNIVNFTQTYKSELTLWNATCSDCTTSACLSYSDFTPLDLSNYTMFIVYFTFYVVFFGLGMFKRPSLKRRLLIPYLCPACAFLYTNLWTAPFRVTCATASSLASLFVFNFMCFVYALSIVRWIYLRNLYVLIRKVNGKKYTPLLRRLASSFNGILMVVFFSIIFSLICLIPIVMIIVMDPKNIYVSFTLYIFVVTLVGCFFALLCISIDMIINRKNIKENGLAKFLLFDDPAYIRIDLMVFLVIVLLLIIFIIITPNNSTASSSINLAIRTIIALVMFLFYGGNAMVIEIYFSIRNFFKKDNTKDANESNDVTAIEKIMIENKDFRQLFKEYSINESSLENYTLFEKLMITDCSKQMTITDMKDIFHSFIKSYAEFEVNISAKARKQYFLFCMEMQDKDLPDEYEINRQDVINILIPEIALNIYDTFSRLRRTKQYTEWKHIYDLHRKEAVVVGGVEDL